jgi:hypothetical protein
MANLRSSKRLIRILTKKAGAPIGSELRLLQNLTVFVMAGRSRLKDGVASLAYVPAIHVFLLKSRKTWIPGTSSAKARFALLPGHDELFEVRF